MRSTLRFILSQPSTDFSSWMRRSISLGSSVGMAMPGTGTPSGPHRRRNISNGSGGVLGSAMLVRRIVEEGAHFAFAADRVLVAQIDQRAAERRLEQQIAREVRARAVHRAGRP